MTHRQRMLATLRREPHDRVPYSVRMDQWYNWHAEKGTLPKKYRGMTAFDIIRSFGGGIQGVDRYAKPTPQPGSGTLFKEVLHNVQVNVHETPHEKVTEYVTPVGTVRTRHMVTEEAAGSGAIDVERFFKDERDYPVLEYLFSNTEIVPDHEGFKQMEKLLGEDGLTFPGLGYSPCHYLMRTVMGYDRFFYELADNREKVERLLRVIEERDRQKVRVAAASPAVNVQVCGNWVDAIHTPVFKKYMTPWFQEIGEVLHGAGKLMQSHIDGEMKRLLPLFLETTIDIGEAFTPAPMTKVTMKDVVEAWGDRVTIWGGLSTVMFNPTYTDQEFDDYVVALVREAAPAHNIIIGMGDNVPMTGDFDRVIRVEQILEKRGVLPVSG
ncbi:MAG: uroporphyrinogen decarboxylase family protein [Chloroflexota bacterium]|nr:uroporphyrinogen decarboxylase family protein [Chloroflexota bacterium]